LLLLLLLLLLFLVSALWSSVSDCGNSGRIVM
jgi:hypothetical protein